MGENSNWCTTVSYIALAARTSITVIFFPRFDRQRPRSKAHMKRHFEEYLKRVFSDDASQDTFHCPVPGIVDDPRAGVEDGFLAISRADMKFIFDPVIVDVVKLVHEQVQKVEAIGQKVSVRCLHSRLFVVLVLSRK